MSNSTPPPGWYPDPQNPQSSRWWDGRAWGPSAPSVAAPVPSAPTHPAVILGTGVFVLAIASLVFFWIPVLGLLLAAGGLAWSIIALTRNIRTWKVVSATVMTSVSFVLGLALTATAIGGAGDEPGSAATSGATTDETRSDDKGSAESGDTGSTADTSDDDDSKDGASAGAEAGTRENPFSFSHKVSNEDWTVKLGKAHEATDEVLAANMFNEKPGKGMEYWIVPVTATYTGDETGWPMMDVSVAFVGDDSKTYTGSCVAPDDLSQVNTLYPGGKGEGNVCVEVPKGADGTWTLRAGVFDDPVFFSTAK